MKAAEVVTAFEAMWKQARPLLRDELLREVNDRIEQFWRATYIREDWCCNEMRRFAVDVWSASKPRPDGHFGTVAYQLRGHVVNYCPFCGVAFAAKVK